MSTPRRADAARNREKILAAARDAFAEPQAEVSMAEVARRAEVGMATLYRNFESRRALLEALYTDEIDAVCAAAASTRGTGTAGEDLMAWLVRFFDFYTAKGLVGRELLRDGGGNDVFVGSRERVVAAGRPLYEAARHSGDLRDELSFDQILDLVIAIAVLDREPAYLLPILRSTLDGLRAR